MTAKKKKPATVKYDHEHIVRPKSKKKVLTYKGKRYTAAQARAGFAGPSNKRRYK